MKKYYKNKFFSFLIALLFVISIMLKMSIPTKALSLNDRIQVVFNFCKSEMDLNIAASCGVLANIEKESSFNPNLYGDNGTSYGICQWHADRFTNLKNWCNSNGYDYTSLNGQLYYLKYELTNNYKSIYNYLKSVPNDADGAYNSAYKWCYSFERPANKEIRSKERGELAQTKYWTKYGEVDYNPDSHTYPSRNIGYYNGTVMTGDDVMWVQCVLYQLGYLSQSGVDGLFGSSSKKAVASFQTDHGLTSDGSCGQITRAKLNECWEQKKNGGPPVDLGDNFYAFIINISMWKHLTVEQNNNVVIRGEKSHYCADQVWKFERQSDNSYKIISIANGECLDVDNASGDSGTNVKTWKDNGSTAQRWFVYKSGNGYILKSKCSDCVLDITSCSSDDGTNVQMYTSNSTSAQIFSVYKIEGTHPFAANIGDGFTASITNVKSWMPINNCGDENITLLDETGESNQLWRFVREIDGSYKIFSCYDNKCIDLENASLENCTNIGLCGSNNNDAQRWFFYESENGYIIQSKRSGKVFDVTNGSLISGANIQAYDWNESDAQIFTVYRVNNVDTLITFSSNTINLSLTSNRTQTVTGKITGDFSHWQNDWDGDIVGIERTENDGEFEWEITARSAGATDMVLVAQDENYNTIVEKKITINVCLDTSDIAEFSFDANGGNFDTSNINVNYEGTIEIPYSVPAKRGYQFVGWTVKRNNDNTWATEENGWLTDSELAGQEVDKQLFTVGSLYRFDDSWINGLSSPSSYTFYAEWKTSSLYTFSYDANGGSFDVSTVNVYYGESIEIPYSVPKKYGYQFLGWTAKRDNDNTWATEGHGWLTESELLTQGVDRQLFGVGLSYGFDDSWTNGLSTISSYTFYAVWETSTLYTFNYDAVGGEFEVSSVNVYYGDEIIIPNSVPTKEGYKFIGWNAKRDDDNTWATEGFGWLTDSELLSQAVEKQLFEAGSTYSFDDSWLYGSSTISSYTFCAVWEPENTIDNPYKLIIESKDAIVTNTATDTISVSLTLDNMPNIKSFALSQLSYNTDVLELTDFKWETEGVIKSWNGSQGALTKEADTDMNGKIISLTFKVKEDITEYVGNYSVSCRFTARQADGTVVQVSIVPGIINIKDVMRGDLDENNIVNEDDAIYLLYSTFFEEEYPLNQDCDFDNNGKTDEDDAIYLLYYTFFPEEYPLNSNQF